MPRNGAGVYTLAQPAFTPQTPISSAAVNSDFSDIASAITTSIASDGQTTMTGALKLDNAGVIYGSDPNTGIRRTASDEQAIFVGGGDVLKVTTTAVLVFADLNVSGRVLSGGGDLVPPGAVSAYAGGSQPTGWLLCNGAAVSRTTYANLFAVIGAIYGAGDGSTTFNIPDMRGRVAAMLDGGTGRLPGYTGLNVSGGASDVALSAANNGPHNHGGFTGSMNQNSIHNHSYNQASNGGSGIWPGGGGQGVANTSTPTSNANIDHLHSIPSDGSGTPHTNVQPTMALNYIIKT